MKVLYFLFFAIFFISSCEEEMQTQAELTAIKLRADISAAGTDIESISVLNMYDDAAIFVGSAYTISSDGFIVITTNADQSATFNLGEL